MPVAPAVGQSGTVAPREHRLALLASGTALFLNAALLFSVQPMLAKTLLPLLGGSAAVWTTCMLFFQSTLLAGYAYADLSARLLSPGRQLVVQTVLIGLALLLLPLPIPTEAATASASPVPWLLKTLARSVGLPVLVLATTAPLVQHWFSLTGSGSARDPYFLYAVSNTGSLGALLAYPLLIEPLVPLSAQVHSWSVFFIVGAGVTMLCGVIALCATRRATPGTPARAPAVGAAPGVVQRIRWVSLAFIPSSLMLAVTTYLSTDIAAVPLLWVVPFAIYLLTYVLAFGRRGGTSDLLDRAAPLVTVALTYLLVVKLGSPLWLVVPVHLIAFGVIALACHTGLAATRPAPEHLTGFYLSLALGGVLGGLFNSVVAPVLFNSIAEYPLVLVCACAVRASSADFSRIAREPRQLLKVPALGVLVVLATEWVHWARLADGWVVPALAIPVLACYSLSRRPALFALAIASMLLAGNVATGRQTLLEAQRSFYGVYRVTSDGEGRYHTLYSGTTVHGQQRVDGVLPPEPLAYFHPSGPVGDVFRAVRRDRPLRVGVVGLGAGGLAAYWRAGDRWTFFEIDRDVERIARDPTLFTYLQRCGATCAVVIGDGRLSLAREPDPQYDLLVIDAFSSDAIPVHLLTREAVQLYLSRLAPDGVLAFHISNRHLDLAPVLDRTRRELRVSGAIRIDRARNVPREHWGSVWFAMWSQSEYVRYLTAQPGWRGSSVSARRVWTDDYSDLFSIVRWR